MRLRTLPPWYAWQLDADIRVLLTMAQKIIRSTLMVLRHARREGSHDVSEHLPQQKRSRMALVQKSMGGVS